MPNLPSYRRREIPSTNIGAAPLPTSAANVAGGAIGQGLSALGQGIGNLGESVAKIKEIDNRNKDLLAQAELDRLEKNYQLDYETKITEDGNKENWPAYAQESAKNFQSSASQLTWGTSRSKALADSYVTSSNDNFLKRANLDRVKVQMEEAVNVTQAQYIKSLGSLDPIEQAKIPVKEAAYREAESARSGPQLVDELINAAKIKGEEEKLRNQVAQAKLDYSDGDTKAIDRARELIQTTALNVDEEKKQAALANLDSYESYIARKNKAEKYTANMNSYKDFGERIADPTKPPVTYDDVELANFDKDQFGEDTKEKWIGFNGYLKRIGEPPARTSTSGQAAISDVVIGIPTGQIGKQEAYDMLLDQYADGNISREDFSAAWEKVDKPYPRPFAENLKYVMDSKEKEFEKAENWGWPYTKKEQDKVLARSQKLNAELIRWADNYFQENGKYPETAQLFEEHSVRDALEPQIDPADSLELFEAPDSSLEPYWDDISEVEKREIYKALEADPNNITEILGILNQ